MAAFVNPRDLLLQAANPRIVPVYIDPNQIPGLPGVIAAVKGVRLVAPSTIFQISTNGTASPATITLTALLTAITGEVQWSIVNGTANIYGTGNSRTLAAAEMSSPTVTIRAQVSFEGTDYIADYTIAKVADGQNGTSSNGTPGSNTALVYAYQRSATQPTTNPGSVIWTFNVAAITTPSSLPNGWSKTIPSGTAPIWVTIATATSTENTDNIAPGEWTTPVVLGSQGTNGTNGLNSTTVWLFTRSFSGTTPPATPAPNLTYNFNTGLISGSLGIWTQTVPLVAGTYLWATTATVASTSDQATILPGNWATPGVLAKDGQDGISGDRGAFNLSGTLANLLPYPNRPSGMARWSAGTPSTANATAADTAARDVIWQALGNTGSALNNAHLRQGDTVIFKNADETAAATGYWGGSAWLHPGLILDGNLLVPNTVTAGKIDSRGLTIRMADGTIVLDASRRLQRSDLIDLGVLAALNSVALGTSQVTGSLPTSNITGLGALALLNSVNLNSQTTGALNGLTQVTNLGGLAYANAVAANQIGAGAVQTGHLAAGAATIDKINVGYGGNKIPNASWITTQGWSFYENIGQSVWGLNNIGGTDWNPSGGQTFGMVTPNNWYAGDNSRVALIASQLFPCVPGQRYEYSVKSAAHNCTAYVHLIFTDAGGNYVAEGGDANPNPATYIGGKDLRNWKQHLNFVVAPEGARQMSIHLRKGPTHPGLSASYAWFMEAQVCEAGPNQTTKTPWQPTGQGVQITASGITTPFLSSIVANLGTITAGLLQSTDGLMSVNLDARSIQMARANGSRFSATPDGFYIGGPGWDPKLWYDLAQNQMILNGVFTANAINAVDSVNIAGQGATTLKRRQFGIASPMYGGDVSNTWITLYYEDVVLKSGGNGIVLFTEYQMAVTAGYVQYPIYRIINLTTNTVVAQYETVRTYTTEPGNPSQYVTVNQPNVILTFVDYNPAAGTNTYAYQTQHWKCWVAHQKLNLTLLASHR